MEPEAIDPGHRSTPGEDSDPLDSEVKDAYQTPFNQGRNIDNNGSCLMEKHEFLQPDRPPKIGFSFSGTVPENP